MHFAWAADFSELDGPEETKSCAFFASTAGPRRKDCDDWLAIKKVFAATICRNAARAYRKSCRIFTWEGRPPLARIACVIHAGNNEWSKCLLIRIGQAGGGKKFVNSSFWALLNIRFCVCKSLWRSLLSKWLTRFICNLIIIIQTIDVKKLCKIWAY